MAIPKTFKLYVAIEGYFSDLEDTQHWRMLVDLLQKLDLT